MVPVKNKAKRLSSVNHTTKKIHYQVCQYLTKSGGHRHCGSGAIVVLVCYVISQDHVIKESSYLGQRSRL